MKKGFLGKIVNVMRGILFEEKGVSDELRTLTPLYDRYVLLARLLPILTASGMIVSPDRLIRLLQLLDTLPPETPASALGPWLAPIFATDPSQQERFAFLMYQALQPLSNEFDGERNEKESNLPTPSKSYTSKQRTERLESKPLYSVDIEQCDEPPYIWSIAPKEDIPIKEDIEHRRTLTRLRNRETSDLYVLDWPTTLRATVARAGMPALYYRARTRPVEYLLLIERFGTDDHRALLFDRLYQDLRQQEVLIERYFYDGDPRRCYNERYPNGIPLREVQYRHSNARLLFMGNGYGLLTYESGKLCKWAKDIFSNWNTRLLLTPLARNRWGLREFQLKSLFLILPATWEALRYVAEYPQPDQTLRYAELPDYVRAAAEWPQASLEAPYLPDLRAQLTSHQLQWVAACAIWPALHFNLTLQFGRLLSDDTHNLLQYEYLARLTALPWFANGYIPKDARRELLEFLETEYPDTLQRCTTHLLGLLHENAPDNVNSYAAAEHTLYIALMQAIVAPKSDENALRHLYTVLKRLNRATTLTDFVMPSSVATQMYFSKDDLDSDILVPPLPEITFDKDDGLDTDSKEDSRGVVSKIDQNKVVSVHYTLTESTADGTLIESTSGGDPLAFIYGIGTMIPDFERNLHGLKVGDTFAFGIKADNAYGPYDESALVELPKSVFEVDGKIADGLLEIGNVLPLTDQNGANFQGMVAWVGFDKVKVDFNHPMAGVDLYFTGRVESVRDASADEIAQGNPSLDTSGTASLFKMNKLKSASP